MNSGPLLFLGIFLTLASSFWGLVLMPQLQIGQQAARLLEETGQPYPAQRPGLAQQGAEVYRSLGCVECHSQQVRGLGGDLERGWGPRISVAQDYLYDYPVMLGRLRLGPDLANVGARLPEVRWHYQHLYNPRLTVPNSPMPRYPFLFEQRRLAPDQMPSADALPSPETGQRHEIVPRPEARALVAYLLSLRINTSLFEAPIPPPPTNASPTEASATNVAATNVAVTNVAVTNTPATNSAPPAAAP